jgi:hypothetical protein
MNAKKCQFIIFCRGNKSKNNINISLFNEKIPIVDSIKFLGITLDKQMCFSNCVEDIRERCSDRPNILKILSNKSLKFNTTSLKAIYFSFKQINFRLPFNYFSIDL